MQARLNLALRRLGLPDDDYDVVDVDALELLDGRRGYDTPTVLCRGRDIFGLPEPVARRLAPT
ncbi:hypothetical protein [Luteitalea sp.]|uniref:hypothetical protein n=1 Tax=Luteitalea sp. TaxID=2004800 RepID=UPI0025BBADB5|nr:hypothetical protein [Luteitalea sp.]